MPAQTYRRKDFISVCVAFLTSTLIVWQATVRAADSPAPSPRLAWLHDGLAFTSTWYALSHSGHATDFKEDENGNFIAPDGTTLQGTERSSTSAGGITQTIISCIDGQKVFLVGSAYSDMRLLGFPDPVSQGTPRTYLVGTNSQVDLWIDPARLDQYRATPPENTVVAPLQWKSGNQMVNAIRVTNVTPNHYIDHIYDANSGLCLHAAEASTGAAPQLKYLAPGDTGQGDTQLAVFDLVSLRDVKTPWAAEPMPTWTSQFKVLHYTGQTQGPNPFIDGPPKQLGLDVTRLDSGNGWLSLATAGCLYVQGQPRFPSKGFYLSGHDQYASFFAGPNALATLQQGQVLDNDPVTHVQTSVGTVDGNSVTIVSESGGGQSFRTFDRQSGKLIAFGNVSALTRYRTTFQLQGEE